MPCPARPHGLRGVGPLWPPLSGQAVKATLFHFTQNSVSTFLLGTAFLLALLALRLSFGNTVPGKILTLFLSRLPGGHVINSPPSNTGAMGLMPGQGTMIPHAKRELSLHATARESLYAPNKESRHQEEPTHYEGDPTQPTKNCSC